VTSPTEQAAELALPGGSLDYILRRSARARRVRVTVDPLRGVIVTVPARRPGARDALASVEPFLRERETWIRTHLVRQARQRSRVAGLTAGLAAGELRDGALLPYRGRAHRIRIVGPSRNLARSGVRIEDADVLGTSRTIILELATRDRRRPARILEVWLRGRAVIQIEAVIARHAPGLGVHPSVVVIRDPRSRWGSASRTGRVALSWRLILAPPEALETTVVHELCHLRVFGHGPTFWALVGSRQPDHLHWRRWLRDHAVELHAVLAEDPAST
jgi:predicted metal-dependent hydrolase